MTVEGDDAKEHASPPLPLPPPTPPLTVVVACCCCCCCCPPTQLEKKKRLIINKATNDAAPTYIQNKIKNF